MTIFIAVFSSGCDSKDQDNSTATVLREVTEFGLETQHTAWLQKHLPVTTVAYFNLPTPWNLLFDAKADALHAVQQLPAHQQQVERIKQGFKNSYFEYLPAEYNGLGTLLVDNILSSIEVAVINHSPTALLPTFAVASRLKGIKADELISQIQNMMTVIDPNFAITQLENENIWSFKVSQFPAFLQYDENSGQLLIYGGMGANSDKHAALWTGSDVDQSSNILNLSQQADPSGLNMKMWLAPARMYQLGGAFVPPEQQKMITELGLDQLNHLWAGFESSQGQSAFAVHLMMPETGWRKMLPTPKGWFDVSMAGHPRSVIQVALPTSEQLKHIIKTFELGELLTESGQQDLILWQEMSAEIGFDFYDILDAYEQQMILVKDESGSWMAIKTKDSELRSKIEDSIDAYFKINSSSKKLAGVDIMQAHFSMYQKLFEQQDSMPSDAKEVELFLNMFKDHIYWYEEGEVIYVSQVPQVLASRKNHPNKILLSDWLQNNQGLDWESAMLAYGKDIQDLPQSMYHYYLLIIQALGDLAQTEVDLFVLPTADQLNLPDHGRLNISVAADAEKVSVKFGYEYSLLEPIVSAEGGLVAVMFIGVMAAYAIPAYQDYTVRAKIGSQLAKASALKVVVAERMIAEGAINENTFNGIEDDILIEGLSYYIDVETGTIVIDLEGVGSAFVAGDDIYLEPSIEEGYIEWFCLSNIKESYLPTECRF